MSIVTFDIPFHYPEPPMPLSTSPFPALLSAWDTWVFTVMLVLVLPALVYFGIYRRARAGFVSILGTYISVFMAQWLMVLGLVVVGRRHHLSLADFGQQLGNPRRSLAFTAILLAGLAVLVLLQLRKLRHTPREEIEASLRPIRGIIPTGALELACFIPLQVTVGICEELLFRGWLLNLLGCATGSIWLGLILSSAAFGLAHAYQGAKGILGTSVVGFGLGLIYLFAGSLVPVQVLHVVVNLVNGLLGAWLLAGLRVHGRAYRKGRRCN